MPKAKPKAFPWRNSRQIAGVRAQLVGWINVSTDGASVVLDLKTAHNLAEICQQAKVVEEMQEKREKDAKHILSLVKDKPILPRKCHV